MIQLTEAAAHALRTAITGTSTPIAGLRLSVLEGGCSGYQYQMGLVESAEPTDLSCESRGLAVFIDPSSVPLHLRHHDRFHRQPGGRRLRLQQSTGKIHMRMRQVLLLKLAAGRHNMTNLRPSAAWVYLDNNATTPVDPRVIDTMLPFFREHFANPSSAHALGVASRDAVTAARRQVQSLLGAEFEKEIIFTSGGTESNNTAILSALEIQQGRNEIVTSVVEHPSVLAVCDQPRAIGARGRSPHPSR